MRRNTKCIPLLRSKMNAFGGQIGTLDDNVALAFTGDGFGNLWVRIAGSASAGSVAAVLAALSADGGQLIFEPGQWSVFSTPAVTVQPVATRAVNATARHVARTISVSINAVAAQVIRRIDLIDDATIVWSQYLGPLAAASHLEQQYIVNIPAVAPNTTMTLQLDAALAGTNFASVALTGYDATT